MIYKAKTAVKESTEPFIHILISMAQREQKIVITLKDIKNYLYLYKRIRLVLFVISLALIFIVIYPFSYCCFLPILEQYIKARIIYAIYEPLELVRCHSDYAWKRLEDGYKFFKGKTDPQERYCFSTHRRSIEYRNDKTKRVENHYKRGQLNGTVFVFFPNGNVFMSSEYKDGLRNGYTQIFRMNGAPWMKVFYKNDRELGKATYYNIETGKIKGLRTYENGDLNGEEIAYDTMGNVLTKGIWKNNIPWNGTFLQYDTYISHMSNGDRIRLTDIDNKLVEIDDIYIAKRQVLEKKSESENDVYAYFERSEKLAGLFSTILKTSDPIRKLGEEK